MRALSLFSGAGGLDLGLEAAGAQVVAMCELGVSIDKDGRRVNVFTREMLARRWPDLLLHDDVMTLDGEQFRGRVDLVAGGSPCQDLSVAGRRGGLDGARSGLFWHQWMAEEIAGCARMARARLAAGTELLPHEQYCVNRTEAA